MACHACATVGATAATLIWLGQLLPCAPAVSTAATVNTPSQSALLDGAGLNVLSWILPGWAQHSRKHATSQTARAGRHGGSWLQSQSLLPPVQQRPDAVVANRAVCVVPLSLLPQQRMPAHRVHATQHTPTEGHIKVLSHCQACSKGLHGSFLHASLASAAVSVKTPALSTAIPPQALRSRQLLLIYFLRRPRPAANDSRARERLQQGDGFRCPAAEERHAPGPR